MENPNKNKAYFLLDVFQIFFYWKTISLSHITSPINIIFFFTLYSLGNRTYFGAYSLTVSPTLPCTCNVSFLSSKTPFYSLLSVSLTIYIYIYIVISCFYKISFLISITVFPCSTFFNIKFYNLWHLLWGRG